MSDERLPGFASEALTSAPSDGGRLATDSQTDPIVADDADVLEEADLIDEAIEVQVAPPQVPKAAAAVDVDAVSADDRAFIDRVFTQVDGVDFRTPPPPPPKGLSGPDKKLHALRDNVRKLERTLARVGHVWRIKQREVELVEQIIATKENERVQAVQRYDHIKQQGTRAAQQHKTEVGLLEQRLAQLDNDNGILRQRLADLESLHENTVAEMSQRIALEEREKEALIADFRRKIAQAQQAFAQLRDQSASHIAQHEARIQSLGGELEATRETLQTTRTTLGERENTIETIISRIKEREATIAATQEELAQARLSLGEHIATLEGELTNARRVIEENERLVASRDADITRMDEQTAARTRDHDGAMARVRKELEEALAMRAQLERRVAERDDTNTKLAEELSHRRADYEKREEELRQQLHACEEELRHTRLQKDDLAEALARIEAAQEGTGADEVVIDDDDDDGGGGGGGGGGDDHTLVAVPAHLGVRGDDDAPGDSPGDDDESGEMA